MKKIVILFISLVIIGINPCFPSEIEDDYLDIAANYCVTGEYNSAMEYLDKILKINPDNIRAQNLKRGLGHVIAGDKTSFVENVNPMIKQAMEYKKIGDEKKELETLLKAARQDNSYLAHYYLGDFYRSKNDYIKALACRLGFQPNNNY